MADLTIEQACKHLDTYLDRTPVKDALYGKRSLTQAVRDFYGFDDYDTPLKSPASDAGSNSAPHELIRIAQPFHWIQFDETKLSYLSVREDFKRWYPGKKGVLAVFRNYFGSMGVAGLAILADLTEVQVAGVIVGGVLTYAVYKDATKDPKNSNGEWHMYEELLKASRMADDFIVKHYKDRILKDLLERDNPATHRIR